MPAPDYKLYASVPTIQNELDTKQVRRLLKSVGFKLSAGPVTHVALGRRVSAWLIRRVERRFAMEGDEASGKWAEHGPAVRDTRGDGAPINYETGQLLRFVKSYRTRPWELIMPGPTSSPRTRMKFAAAQTGVPVVRGLPQFENTRIPARPVLVMNDYDHTQIRSIMLKYVREAVEG